MRVLLIKTSSMGDIIHTLPALTDAKQAIADITFDWVVEDVFSAIPHWHSSVDKVIPVALRRWRKGIFSEDTRLGWRQVREQFKEHQYDLILDAQGLVKSALLTFFARGKRTGLDWNSAREALASLAYQRKYKVNFQQHAIVRMRSLFSQALGYELPDTIPDFGLAGQAFLQQKDHKNKNENYLVFLHGTAWVTKQWPEAYWVQLGELVAGAGYRIKISGGNDEEVARAARIAKNCPAMDVVPYLNIVGMAELLSGATAAVAVDTGFGHLAAAFDIPTVSVYGPTDPNYTGVLGKSSIQLAANFPCAPCLSRKCTYDKPATAAPACYTTVQPVRVWEALREFL